MGKAKVGLVRAAGVTTVRELALRNPARLAESMKEVNTRRKLVRVLPSEKSVEQLIAQARKLSPRSPIRRPTEAARPAPARAARPRRLDSPARTAQSDRMIATTSRSAPAAASAGHPLLPALLSRPYPAVMGVLNITPDSFSDGGQVHRAGARAGAGPAHDRGRRRHHRHRRGIHPALWRCEPVSAEEELQRLQPVLAEVVSLGIPVSIDSMKSAVVAWALDAGAAIANDVWGLQRDPGMARLVAARRVPVIVMHNRDRADARHRHHAGYCRLLRPLARDRRQGGHFARKHRARSRHRLRQDARAEHDRAGPAGRTRHLRPAAPGRRVAQAFYQFGRRHRSRISGLAARSPRIWWRRRAARGSSGPTTCRRPYRRCAWQRRSGTSDDRHDLHHRRRHPCPPWRHGT